MKICLNIMNMHLVALVIIVCSCQLASAQSSRDTVKTGKANDGMAVDPGHASDNMNMPPATTNDGMAAMTDTGFISKNIRDNETIIALSKMGATKGNAAVKTVAGKLLSDHTAAISSLKKLASAKGMDWSARKASPTPPSMKVEPTGNFNTTWASLMITLHDEKIKELENYQTVTSDKNIRHAIGIALPFIRSHRQMIARLPGAKSMANQVIH